MQLKQAIRKALGGYVDNLTPSEGKKRILREAREHIRDQLRQFIRDQLPQNPPVRIRFKEQGSCRYKTVNLPCYPPRQQMDLDDGMYIPRSAVEKVEAAQLLKQVAEYLRPLAKKHGWGEPQAKHSCVRIVIDNEKHIDIPVYRIADGDIKDISDHTPHGVVEFADIYKEWGMSKYWDAPKGAVELATNQGWRQSDARNIFKWVAGCRARFGKRFIDFSRILKGWRDHQWPEEKSPLSSILIMAMVEAAMVEACISANSTESDDQAFWDVVSVIADTVVHREIPDPDESVDEPLTGKWTAAERAECARKFDALRRALNNVLGGSGGIEELRKQFGKFFPSDASLIKPCAIKKPAVVAGTTATTAATARPYGKPTTYDDLILRFRWMLAMVFSEMEKCIAAAIDYFFGKKFNLRRMLVSAMKKLIALAIAYFWGWKNDE